MECLPLWPTDICEKGRTLSKTYGIKARAIGNTHGEHIENLLEQIKNEKKSSSFPPPFPPQNLKENPWGTHWEPVGIKGK
jgi:hypothetical protein